MQDPHLCSAHPQLCLCRGKRGEEEVQVGVRVAPSCAGSTPVPCRPTVMSPSREEVVQVGVGVGPRCAVNTHIRPLSREEEGRGGTGGGRGGSTLCRIHTCAVQTHHT